VAWLVGSFWLFLLWGVALLYAIQFEAVRFLGAAFIEFVFVLSLSGGLGFLAYMRDPTRRLLPSIVLCTVLALDMALIIERSLSSKAEFRQALRQVNTSICQKTLACVPDADVAACVRRTTPADAAIEAAGYIELGSLVYVYRTALQKCEPLECDEFAQCVDRELSILTGDRRPE
jgi:hypothetical protein